MTENPKNPRDPLYKTGPTNSRALFRVLSDASNGAPTDAVIDAALNLIINALRMNFDTRDKADARLAELTARCRGVLMEQYDSLGRRRGVYPYDQVIRVPHTDFRQ